MPIIVNIENDQLLREIFEKGRSSEKIKNLQIEIIQLYLETNFNNKLETIDLEKLKTLTQDELHQINLKLMTTDDKNLAKNEIYKYLT